MQHHRPNLPLQYASDQIAHDRPKGITFSQLPAPALPKSSRAVTLVEAMFALGIMGMFMLGFIGTFVQSRRATEASVLHAACTSVIYGVVEQIKQLEYTKMLPYNGIEADPANSIVADPTAPDPSDPDDIAPPNVRVRINQNVVKCLRVVYTPAPVDGSAPTPAAPTTTPAPTATAASVGAIDNWIGALPLSTVTGSMSQQINLNIWVWIDEIPDANVTEIKRITIVYTYSYLDGSTTRTVRDKEVFIRTRFDK